MFTNRVQTHLRGRGAALSAGGWSPEGGRRYPAPLHTPRLSGRARLFRTSTPASASDWGRGVRTGWGAGGHPQTPATPDAVPAATSVHPPRERAESPRLPAALELSSLHPHPAPPCPASPRLLIPQCAPPHKLLHLPSPLPAQLSVASHSARQAASRLPTPRAVLPSAPSPGVAHRALAPSPRPLPFSSTLCALSRPPATGVPQAGECRVVWPGGTRARRWGDAPSSFPGFPRLPAPRLRGSQKSCK